MPLTHLTDRAVLSVTGPDARALLHNVMTADMNRVDQHGSGYGALLTPQGKILWDFIIHAREGGYALDLRANEVESFAKRLMLYRLRSKVEIRPQPDLAVIVSWGEPDGERADPRLAALGSRTLRPLGEGAIAPEADWHVHRIALAVPEGGVDFVFGDTFPHDAAMDSLNGVAFDKGCYIGQEVVSRMRHRGTARRRIVAISGEEPLPEPGTEIVAAGRPLGRLGSSAGGRAVGVVRLDRTREALDAGLAIEAGGRQLSVSLPSWASYGWPEPAAGAGE